jgi:hypothetical protein
MRFTCTRIGLSTGAKALSACEWCPRFFFNTSAPGATSVTVRAGRVGRAPERCAAGVRAFDTACPAPAVQNCSFMTQSVAWRAGEARLLLRTMLLLAGALACALC